jgi:hypothetical protein
MNWLIEHLLGWWRATIGCMDVDDWRWAQLYGGSWLNPANLPLFLFMLPTDRVLARLARKRRLTPFLSYGRFHMLHTVCSSTLLAPALFWSPSPNDRKTYNRCYGTNWHPSWWTLPGFILGLFGFTCFVQGSDIHQSSTSRVVGSAPTCSWCKN